MNSIEATSYIFFYVSEFVIIYSRKQDKLTSEIKNRLSRLLEEYGVNANNLSSFDQSKETCKAKTEKVEL